MDKTILNATINRHQGCWITTELPDQSELFKKQLQNSLVVWQAQGIKVVWLTIPKSRHTLIVVAVDLGFDFHHVTLEDGQALVLTKRLIDNAIIPEFANHKIGVGGIVFNDNNEVLTVVGEHDMQIHPGHFKFPGGAVDRHEMLCDAVVREVFEETGVRAKFNGVVGFRHHHKGQFSTSDIYFLCHLTAIGKSITPCPEEIGLAQWMDIDSYLSTATVIEFNKGMLRKARRQDYLIKTELALLMSKNPKENEIYL